MNISYYATVAISYLGFFASTTYVFTIRQDWGFMLYSAIIFLLINVILLNIKPDKELGDYLNRIARKTDKSV